MLSCEIKYFERIVLHCDYLNPSVVFSVYEKISRNPSPKFLPKNFTVVIKFYSHQLMQFFIQLCISLLSYIKIT